MDCLLIMASNAWGKWGRIGWTVWMNGTCLAKRGQLSLIVLDESFNESINESLNVSLSVHTEGGADGVLMGLLDHTRQKHSGQVTSVLSACVHVSAGLALGYSTGT